MYLSGQDNPIWPAQDFRSWPHEKSPIFGHYNKSFIDQQACSLKMVRSFPRLLLHFYYPDQLGPYSAIVHIMHTHLGIK